MVPVLGLNIRSEEIQTPKKRTRWKNRTSRSKILLTGLKTLLFFSFRMKDTNEMIHFYIQSRSVQGLVYVQIKKEYATNLKNIPQIFSLKTAKLAAITNLWSLLTWKVSVCLRIFMLPRFQMKLATLFISNTRRIFTKF